MAGGCERLRRMTHEPSGLQPGEIGALNKDQMSYGDYLCLDTLLSAQQARSSHHDELLFVIQHQTTELWMKLALHELQAALSALRAGRIAFASKVLVRVARVLEQMNDAWDVLRTMTPSEFIRFRARLEQSSDATRTEWR